MDQTLTDKQRYWTEQLKEAEQSGRSLADYARSRNIPAQKLYQWRNLLKKQVTTAVTTETQFAEVIHSAAASSSLTIHLPGAELCFSSLPEADWLARLLTTVPPQK